MPTTDRPTIFNRGPARRFKPASVLAPALIALLVVAALAALAPHAAATHTDRHDSDAYVSDLVLPESPVVGEPVDVTAVLHNQGHGTWGGPAERVRICFIWVPEDGTMGDNTDCSQSQMTGNDALNRAAPTSYQQNEESSRVVEADVPAGERMKVTLEWTPHENRGDQDGPGRIGVMIGPGLQQVHDQGPFWFDVTVHKPDVGLERQYHLPANAEDIEDTCESYDPVKRRTNVSRGNCLITPGDVVAFEVRVNNSGNKRDIFNLSVDADASDPIENWNVTFSPSRPILEAGHNRTVLMIVESARTGETAEALHNVNVGQPRKESASVTVTAASTTDPTREETIVFPALRVKPVYDVNLTTWEPVRAGNVSEEIRFNYSIGNPGNGDDTYEVTYVARESTLENGTRWKIALGDDATVSAGQNKTRYWTLEPPEGTPTGRYNITLRVASLGDVTGDAVTQFTFQVEILQTFEITGVQNLERQVRVPAEAAIYELKVTNRGNGPDVVDFDVDREGDTHRWSWTLEPEELHIGPKETKTAYLTVTSPRGEEPDRGMWVNVTGYSSGPEDDRRRDRPSVEFNTFTGVKRGANFEVVSPVDGDAGFIDADENRTFQLRVRNLGNVWDNVTLDTSTPIGWSATVEPARVGFVPADSRVRGPTEATVTVTVTAPRSASVGDRANVQVDAVSEVDQALTRATNLPLMISGPDLAVTGLRVNTPDGVSGTYAGDNVTVSVTVRNDGNKAPGVDPLVRLTYTSGDRERIVGERVLDGLSGGRSRTVTLPWDVSGLSGSGEITARVDPAGEVEEISTSNNDQTLAGDQTFVRLFDLSVQPAEGQAGRPGERVHYLDTPHAFTVKNLGNRMERVTLEISSREGWTEAEERQIRLEPGESRLVDFHVDIPERPGVAQDETQLKVTPANRLGDVIRTAVVTGVVDDSPPEITDVRVEPEAPVVDERATIRATVVAALGVDSATAVLRTPVNDTEEVALTRIEGDTWGVEHAFPYHGEYRLYVEAVDRTAGANRADTRHEPVVFRVMPGSAPVITAVTDLSVPIRSGTNIEFEIEDAVGVSSAHYVIAGEEHAIPGSGLVDTSEWRQGNVDFTVVAENVHGVRTEAPFTAFVDNTPPEVADVTVEPERPREGEELTIRVNVDESVDGVDVIVKRSGEVVETLPANKVSPGVFTLAYTPEAGNYDFDVVARDAAGNEAFVEDSVAFSTTGAIVPGPGPALGVLAVVGAAVGLAVTRRRGTR